MNTIELHQTLPEVFVGKDLVNSDIWHRQIVFQRGQICLIEAASGTGKSSLFSFIYGYRQDYQGIITFDGSNIRNLNMKQWVHIRKMSLAIMFQELRLFPELSSWENIKLKNNLTGYCKKSMIEEWAERLGIADKMYEKTGKMSFGQQQRVAFIRMLCQPADFLLLDEPISHLDDGNGQVMSIILKETAQQRGCGILVSSIGKHLPLQYDRVFSL